MERNITEDELVRAHTNVDPLLTALRRESERLAPDADSALTFDPDGGAGDPE